MCVVELLISSTPPCSAWTATTSSKFHRNSLGHHIKNGLLSIFIFLSDGSDERSTFAKAKSSAGSSYYLSRRFRILYIDEFVRVSPSPALGISISANNPKLFVRVSSCVNFFELW